MLLPKMIIETRIEIEQAKKQRWILIQNPSINELIREWNIHKYKRYEEYTIDREKSFTAETTKKFLIIFEYEYTKRYFLLYPKKYEEWLRYKPKKNPCINAEVKKE